MWDAKASGPNTIGYRFSASATLLNHLAVCQYQSSTVKSTALHDPACMLKKTDTSSAGTSAQGRTLQRTISLATLSHLPFVNVQAGVPDPSSSAGSPMILSPLILTSGNYICSLRHLGITSHVPRVFQGSPRPQSQRVLSGPGSHVLHCSGH